MKAVRLLVVVCATTLTAANAPVPGLAIAYGDKGIQSLKFNGVTLADVGANTGDGFSIRHMRVTDLEGNVRIEYGWGDNFKQRSFDKAKRTMTTVYGWGSIAVQFSQLGNTLNVLVTEVNKAGSESILQGAAIYLVNFRFPKLPEHWENVNYPQVAYSTFGPAVISGDWGSGEVTAVDPNVTDHLYMGFLNDGTGKANYYPVASTIPPEGLPSFAPQYAVPVAPGSSFRFKISLRFGPSGTLRSKAASDVYAAWGRTYPLLPVVKNWDRRPIGTVFLATSPTGGKDEMQPGGCGAHSGNPRNYFHDCKINVNNPSGLRDFQTRVLKQGEQIVNVAQKYGWQGAITWDVEGEEWPQATSYVCSPDQIAQVAPEMESVVDGQTGALAQYNGRKLDVAYFGMQTAGGLKVGVCTRPQQFVLNANGTAKQNYVSDEKAATLLNTKMRFANSEWGATMFYADTFVHADGGNVEPAYFRKLMQVNPRFLLMPEINSQNYAVPASFQYSAPLYNFENHTDLGTPTNVPDIYTVYPSRFSGSGVTGPFGVNLINDVNEHRLAQNRAALIRAAAKGDIMMGHADYDQANDAVIEQIYKSAQVSDGALTSSR